MRSIRRIGLPVLGAFALLLTTTTSAFASATITSGGVAYTGNVRATNIGGNVTLSGTSTLGLITNTCTGGTLDAYIQSNGLNGQLTGVGLTGCTNNKGGTTTVTALNLPYSGGQVDYAAIAGGRDGKITIFAPNLNVLVRAVLTLPSIGIPSLTCDYGLTTSTALVIDVYNGANANRPVTTNSHSQGKLAGQSLQRTSSDVRCPATAVANGKFQIVTNPGGADLVLAP
ncbi:hypothetical protein [Actinocorallia longicatena]|uniref:Neocarzinostatin family protein n=1 Tax=Actinocorallia longicatena TaxID=111803 RepID=A0ABP6QMX6_9ACTN